VAQLEEGAGVDVVYLDFAKAFDKVDHCVLFRKQAEAVGGRRKPVEVDPHLPYR
jgi:hypothetical protein